MTGKLVESKGEKKGGYGQYCENNSRRTDRRFLNKGSD